MKHIKSILDTARGRLKKTKFGRINENMLDRGKKDVRIERESVHSDEVNNSISK